ncbi:MAG: nucleotidyltransferase domain-containing protein [Pseudomonadota bacterium]
MGNNIQKLQKYFKENEEITLAFLFGSQAKQRASKLSDYDIAIWTKKKLGIAKINRIWSELQNILQKDVDLILLNSAKPAVAWAALRGEKLLIRDFSLYLRLVLDVSREAEEMQDFIISLWNLKKRYKKHDAA